MCSSDLGNCTTLGIPCVVMSRENRQRLAESIALDPEAEVLIDLEDMQVHCANASYPVTMKESTRESFLAATFDPLDDLLSADTRIRETAEKLGYA